jgi:Cu/Ag efflux pump CusA
MTQPTLCSSYHGRGTSLTPCIASAAAPAAVEAASLRFRPVIMTSFAFILGLLPLVIAVGTPVFGGMIAASLLGIFLIPLLYITAEGLRGWRGAGKKFK